MINIVIFGPPGSGKGTQAKKIADKYGYLHISTGDLFRYEIGNQTPLGLEAKSYMDKGELVPDSITINMLRNKVEMNPEVSGVIFDGFPRTIHQAEALDQLLEEKDQLITSLIALEVDDEEIVKRILERALSSGRSDDADEGIIKNRIKVYNAETAPLFDFYDKKEKAHKIEGIGDIEQIFNRLCALIETLR